MPDGPSSIRKPGAAASAVAAVVITASFLFLPLAGTFAVAFLPAAIAMTGVRGTRRLALVVSLVCIVSSLLLSGSVLVTLVVFPTAVSGLVMGNSVALGERDDRALLRAALVPFVATGITAGAFFLMAGKDPWSLLGSAMDRSIADSIQIYRGMGMSEADIQAIRPSLMTVKGILTDYLPAVFFYCVGFSAFASYMLVKRRLMLSGMAAPGAVSLSAWAAPDHLVWAVIVSGFMMVPSVPPFRQAGGNLLAVFAAPYLFQGFGVVFHFFNRLKLSPVVRGLAFLVVFFQPFIIFFVWAAGLFDVWLDFRRIRPKPGR